MRATAAIGNGRLSRVMTVRGHLGGLETGGEERVDLIQRLIGWLETPVPKCPRRLYVHAYHCVKFLSGACQKSRCIKSRGAGEWRVFFWIACRRRIAMPAAFGTGPWSIPEDEPQKFQTIANVCQCCIHRKFVFKLLSILLTSSCVLQTY